MATQTLDVLRSLGQPASDVMEALSLLHEIALNLSRLVELEEERRVAERQMEALAEALQPSNDEPEPPTELVWYRDARGNFLERDTGRPLTQQEIEAVTYSPRREARERRSR